MNGPGNIAKPAADIPDRRFWRAARMEMRATWGSHRRWVWIAGAFIVEAMIIGLFTPPVHAFLTLRTLASRPGSFNDTLFYLKLLCATWPPLLVWTGAAALSADLLSLQYPGNPTPHREWHPREFAARAAGRLLPWLGWSKVWLGTWLAMEWWTARVAGPGGTWRISELVLPLRQSWRDVADILMMLLLPALPFAAAAALLSATSRRPRWGRIIVSAWLIVLLLSTADGAVAYAVAGSYPRRGQLVNEVLWAGEILAALGLVWWIAARRYRRHPYTGSA